jgi:hypothetical protein
MGIPYGRCEDETLKKTNHSVSKEFVAQQRKCTDRATTKFR